MLLEDLREVGIRILALNFDDPKDDAQLIRHHAYLKGKLQALQLVLDDNFEDPTIQPESNQS